MSFDIIIKKYLIIIYLNIEYYIIRNIIHIMLFLCEKKLLSKKAL